MNEIDYARMIEIPVSSCDVVSKKGKGFFKRKRSEALKQELIQAVNEENENFDLPESEEQNVYESVEVTTKAEEKKRVKRSFKPDIITAQVGVIIVLALTIMFTNIFWQDSGINNIVKGVFGEVEYVEDVAYTEFVAQSPIRTAPVSLSEGIMTFSEAGSIYPICDGIIKQVAQNAQKLDVTIEFSPSFTAVISGVDYAYYGIGDAVYKSLPVCYSQGGEVKVCLYSNGSLLTNYVIDNGKLVWQS